MNEQKSDTVEVELMPISATEAMERATIDMQIATAKRYPRSLDRFKKSAISMATLDDETAESCLYSRPVGKDRDTGKEKYAEGMSVRMAEIVGASYGNMRVQAVIVEQTERFVRARGMAIDLESNFASSSEVIESTVKKNGQPYDERMRIVIAKSALAKARRDATFQVVPRALAKPVENAVRMVLVGDAKSLDKRRQIVVGWIGKLGIDPKRVYASLGIKGEAELDADHLQTLTGIKTAIKEGDVTIDGAFPDSKPEAGETIADALGGKKGDQKAEPPTAAEPTAEEKAKADEARASFRKTIVSGLEALILDGKTTEKALLEKAKKLKLAPWDKEPGYTAGAIGELPAETLAKLLDAKP